MTTISGTSATIKIRITSDGGAAITEMGIFWRTGQNSKIEGNRAIAVTGSFVSYITGLTPVTTYYIRAYATNSAGTAYSNRSTFTTIAMVPVLTTSAVTDVTSTSAICGGMITNDGGGEVTARGICWRANQNPTIADNKTLDGTGSGSFASCLTGLKPDLTYYIRAYANNNAGTACGNQVSLITDPAVPNDYLPLMAGSKYKYNYCASYTYIYESQ